MSPRKVFIYLVVILMITLTYAFTEAMMIFYISASVGVMVSLPATYLLACLMSNKWLSIKEFKDLN